MGRRNHSKGRPQAKRGIRETKGLMARDTSIARIPVSDLIMPDGRCYGKPGTKPKAFYLTEAKADKALRQAQVNRRRQGFTYAEKRYYKCPLGDHYHLTSREQWEERPLRREAS